MFKKIINTECNYAALFLRLALGIMIFPHGAQKVLGWFEGPGFSGTVETFGQMGMPAFMVILIMAGEFLGGVALIVGFLTRIAAAGVGIIMIGALAMVHAQFGFFMNWFGQKQGEGFEFHILALGIALALIILGGGRFSLDCCIVNKCKCKD